MSWPSVELGDICKPKQHKTIPSSELLDEGFVVYGANGPIGYYSEFTHNRTTIAITCRGATCGTINVVPHKSYITGNAMALDDLDESRVELKFLRYALEHQGFKGVINGAAQPQITRGPLLTYKIPLPPLEEQRRIAGILDQADALCRLRTRALDKLNTLGQAIFHEMFEDNSDVPRELLGDLIEARSSLADPTLDENAELPHVGPEHIQNGGGVIEWQRVVSCREDGVTSGKYRFEPNDVIYSKIRPYLNKVAIADRVGMCSADMYALLPKTGQINTRYLHAILSSAEFLSYGSTVSGRANIPKMNRKQLMAFKAPLPASALQAVYEQRVEALDQEARKQKAHLGKSEALFASLQHRAFRGEL
jgi:type I restriction enzyme S subunit